MNFVKQFQFQIPARSKSDESDLQIAILATLSNSEQTWAILSNTEQHWAKLNNIKQHWAILNKTEQHWARVELILPPALQLFYKQDWHQIQCSCIFNEDFEEISCKLLLSCNILIGEICNRRKELRIRLPGFPITVKRFDFN